MMEEMVYQKLAEHLDRLPEAFPSTESGVELRILKKLFSPEHAKMALLLRPMPEVAEVIAQRAGMDAAPAAAMLEDMSSKGLIFSIKSPGQAPLYMAAAFIMGIWEYQVNRLEPDFVREVNQYLPHYQKSTEHLPPQLRTIPVARSVENKSEVLVYEQGRELIKGHWKIVATPCICRKEHQIAGEGCDKPLETCLSFDWVADYYERNGLGRAIGEEEALAVLQQAEEAGLVLQPSDAQQIMVMCCCCGDCCQILLGLKRHPKPADLATSSFMASLNQDECTGCEICLERCQMEALTMTDRGVASLDLDRCIGCGLCVTTCPSEALSLVRKPGEQIRAVPATRLESHMERAQLRARTDVADKVERHKRLQ